MTTKHFHITLAAIAIMVQLIFGFQGVLPATGADLADSGAAGRGVCNDIVCG